MENAFSCKNGRYVFIRVPWNASAFKAAVALQKYDFSGKAKIVWSNA